MNTLCSARTCSTWNLSVAVDTLQEAAETSWRGTLLPSECSFNITLRQDISAMEFQRDSAADEDCRPRIEECSTRNTCAEPSAWPVEGRLAQNLADADFETPHFLLATQWRQRSPAHGRNGGRYVPRETSVTHAGGLESGKDQTTLLYEQVYELDG